MIFGGDLGNRPVNADMNIVAASHDPYAAFIGGDIVYDNGYLECYCMYDRFLTDWQKVMVRSDGALIPIVPAVGNHDAGKNAFSGAYHHNDETLFNVYL